MAVKTLNIELSRIKQEPFNRFDVKFYLVNHFFDKLAKQHNFKVESLNNLKENIISGSYIDSYTTKEEGIPYLRVGDIKPFCFDENEDDLAYVSKSVPEKIKIKVNDILVARTQATIDKLGTASVADKTIEGWATSQHTTRIIVNPKKISPYYLVAYFNSKFFKAQAALASHGDTRVEMTHSQLNQVKVFIPEKKLLDDIIEKVKKIILYHREGLQLIHTTQKELLKQMNFKAPKSNLSKAKYFSTDVAAFKETDMWNPNCHLPFYEEVTNEIKKNKTIKLNQIAEPLRGHEPGSENYIVYLDKGKTDVPFIRTSDIINFETDLFPDYYLDQSVYNEYSQDILPGDVLFSKDGKIGEVALITNQDKIFLQSHIFRLRLNKEALQYHITPEYLFLCLSCKEIGKYQAKRFTVIQSTIPTIANRINEFDFPILSKKFIEEATEKIRKAFEIKNKRKDLITEIINQIDSFIPYKI